MFADRVNRMLLSVLGLALLAVGVAVILAGTYGYGRGVSGQRLLDNPAARFVGANGVWFWPVAALALALLALLALRWLAAAVPAAPRRRHVAIDTDRAQGQTTLDSGAFTSAVTAEVEECPGVDSADTRLLGSPHAPRLALTVTAEPDADIAAVRERLEADVLPRVRHVLGKPDLPVVLDLTYPAHRWARVG